MDALRIWNERQGTVSALEFLFFIGLSALVGFLIGVSFKPLIVLVFE